MTARSISRRRILKLVLASPLAAAVPGLLRVQGRQTESFARKSFSKAPSRVVPVSARDSVNELKLTRQWKGSLCLSRLTNSGMQPVKIKEVVLFDLQLPLPASTRLYDVSFQMLTQTGGTL